MDDAEWKIAAKSGFKEVESTSSECVASDQEHYMVHGKCIGFFDTVREDRGLESLIKSDISDRHLLCTLCIYKGFGFR